MFHLFSKRKQAITDEPNTVDATCYEKIKVSFLRIDDSMLTAISIKT